MNFCPNCGVNIQFTESKYCHNCGVSLIVASDVNEPSRINKTVEQSSQKTPAPPTEKEEIDGNEGLEPTAHYKGTQFEYMVEEILKAQRYTTYPRQRLEGKEGGKSEIDILAVKKYRGEVRKLVVECKNYEKPVSVAHVRDFHSKLESLKIKNGLFVTFGEFSSEALIWLKAYGIQFWDGATVREKDFERRAGRLKTGEKVNFEYNLPLNIDYAQAIRLDLSNKEKVETSAKLKWIPFYRVFYEVDCRYSDPIKRKHRITDSGFYIVNALLKTPKEEKETQMFMKELEKTPAQDQSFDQPEEYRLIKLSPHIMQGDARAQTIDYVIQKNTKSIWYDVPSTKRKRRDDLGIFDEAERREWILKPSPKDVRIRGDIQIVYAPKWEIEFQSRDYTYVRILSGNSGAVLADNITYCSKHWLGEFLGIQKKNVAVCDTCGQALCQEHVFKCPVCTSWQCEKHSVQCAGCKKMFCADHIKNKCIKCSRDICDACTLRCPICGEIHCNGHMTKCSRCGKNVCVSCTRKEGGLVFKKTVCKNC